MGVVKLAGWLLGAVVLAVAGVAVFGPREKVEVDVRFDESRLAGGVEEWFRKAESAVPDITPGTEKRVIWARAPEKRTPVSVLYVHGFSATSEEIRPVPDRVARALGANLVFTRLAGHGVPGSEMGKVTVRDWMQDVAEALAVARAVGDRVLVMGTSTGATLATIAAADPEMARAVAGFVFVSPNFRVKNPAAALLTWPGARWWLPLIAGKEIAWEPVNEAHGRYWTNRYPSTAAFPMGAAVQYVRRMDLSGHRWPVLMLFDPQDKVVDHTVTRETAERWGGPATIVEMNAGPGDDPYHHVIAGDILSPGQTDRAVAAILDWWKTVP